MISDFIEAVGRGKNARNKNDASRGYTIAEDGAVIIAGPSEKPFDKEKATKLAELVRKQNEPQPPRIFTPQEKFDLQVKAEKSLAAMIEINTPKEPPRKADAELTPAERNLVEAINRNMLK